MEGLDEQILKYTPIHLLCERFTPQDVLNVTYNPRMRPKEGSITQHGFLLYLPHGVRLWNQYAKPNVSLEWFMDYLWFLFDYAGLDINMTVGYIPSNRITEDKFYELTPLDWIYYSYELVPRDEPVKYLLKKGARSCVSISWLLHFIPTFCVGDQDHDCGVKILLDAGANIRHTEDAVIVDWYNSRQACLKQCITFIGCITRRKPELKTHGLSKDIYTLIGKLIWEKRFP